MHASLRRLLGVKTTERPLLAAAGECDFYDSHSVDTLDQLWFAMDLTPLIKDDAPTVKALLKQK